MPSLVTSRNAPAGKGFSRVNSFKREWDDDVVPSGGSGSRGRPLVQHSSQEIVEWSPSPPRIKQKIAAESVIAPLNPLETAADRRRKAILAAMNENTASTSTSTAGSSLHTIASSLGSSSRHAPLPSFPSAQREPPTSSFPELPPTIALDSKKRALPWNADMASTKAARHDSIGSEGSSKSSKKTGSTSRQTKATISIKQKVSLSAEQQKVLSLVVDEGKNVFFTGSAGTGKSVLLREIIRSLQKKFATSPDAVAVTASTGIAACNIGGVTLHSFGGVGLAIDPADKLVAKLKKNKKGAARWLRTKVLIIDEISMVDAELFDKFCKVGQFMRKNQNQPWGGIQIIVTGDFFQLPPVTKGGAVPKFCFEAQMWNQTIDMSVNLTKVFRQKDPRFIDMLNEMRFGRLSSQSIKAFQSLSREIVYDDGIEPTELFPRREDVDKANRARLESIYNDCWTYVAVDGGAVTDQIQRDKLLANFMAPQTLQLKIDAQVMLIKNIDETLVNGSMGKVIGFCHKGMFECDASGRYLEDGVSEGMDAEEREQLLQKRRLTEARLPGGIKPHPVVRFSVPGGGKRDMFMEMDAFKAELPNGEVQASRSQFPLILAWAMSIHKSQGQTLDRVKVDLSKVFEKGQAYVALSRATSLEGLQVKGFSADKVMAHRKVAIWSETLKNLNV